MKSIYILDDHPIITERDCTIAGKQPAIPITTGHHYSELYNYLNDHTPDLLIIDYEIQDKTALDVITYLQRRCEYSSTHLYHAYGVLDYQTADQSGSSRYRDQK